MEISGAKTESVKEVVKCFFFYIVYAKLKQDSELECSRTSGTRLFFFFLGSALISLFPHLSHTHILKFQP